MSTLQTALAELVQQAEVTLAAYKEDMDAWSYAEYDGKKHKYEDLAPGLCAAINNARQALASKGTIPTAT